jgi:hypothetical protein
MNLTEKASFINQISEDYWGAPLPCPRDKRIMEIGELYQQAPVLERQAFLNGLTERGCGVLSAFSTRMAMLGARTKSEVYLIYAIVALTISSKHPRWEYYTTLMDLAPLYHSACLVGEPRQIFEAGVAHEDDERIRSLILGFLDRDPRDQRLEAMGWEAIEGPSGLIYRFGNQPIPQGHL